MRALSRVAEAMTLTMLEHYGRKWDLYLRGLGEVREERGARS
jgi:hypothetical protein